MVARLREGDFLPGEQRAYIMARVLEDVNVIFAGPLDPEPLRAIGFLTAADLPDAVSMAGDIAGRPANLLVVPHALLTLPVVAAGAAGR
jgi:hypothetical protein